MRTIAIEVPDRCNGKCILAHQEDSYRLIYTCPYRKAFMPGRTWYKPVKACREAELPQGWHQEGDVVVGRNWCDSHAICEYRLESGECTDTVCYDRRQRPATVGDLIK